QLKEHLKNSWDSKYEYPLRGTLPLLLTAAGVSYLSWQIQNSSDMEEIRFYQAGIFFLIFKSAFGLILSCVSRSPAEFESLDETGYLLKDFSQFSIDFGSLCLLGGELALIYRGSTLSDLALQLGIDLVDSAGLFLMAGYWMQGMAFNHDNWKNVAMLSA